jgi:large subunit ribosomal protein L15
MPLHRRLPKRGFKSFTRVEYQVVNLRDLTAIAGDVTPESLKQAGLITSLKRPVKVLGDGAPAGKVSVSAHAFSKSAREKIEAAGGSVTVLEAEARAGSESGENAAQQR